MFISMSGLRIPQHPHLHFKYFQIIIHVFNLNEYIFWYIYHCFLLTINQIQMLHLMYYFSCQKQMDIVIQILINFYFLREYLIRNKILLLQFNDRFPLLYHLKLVLILILIRQYHNLYLLIPLF